MTEQTNNKPTAEEIERVLKEMLRVEDKSGLLGVAEWHCTEMNLLTKERDELDKMTDNLIKDIDHHANLGMQYEMEADHLRTQLELEQSKVARCVEEIKGYRDVEEHGLMIDSMNEFLSSLPTTSNLVQQVKESEELVDAMNKSSWSIITRQPNAKQLATKADELYVAYINKKQNKRE